jgi:UDP-glucose 4-epimerase
MAYYLVTGGAGFIGSHLVETLLSEKHRVRVLDDLSSGSRSNLPANVDFTVGDVADPYTVELAFAGIDACFHLAAIASVDACNRDWLRSHQVNLTGTINVFNRARRAPRPVPVVYASSAAVYGDCSDFPVGEGCEPAPLSAYGADKRACELHARVAGAVYRVPTIGLRFFNVYGPRQDPGSPYSGVISIFLGRLRRGEAVDIFGDGAQMRDFVYVGDAVRALRRALAAADVAAPVFNICTGEGTTVRALAETVAAQCRTRLVAQPQPPRSGEIQISIGDPSRAADRLGFTARTGLAEGIALTLAAFNREAAATDCVLA